MRCDFLSQLAWRSNEAKMSESHLVYLNLGSNIEPEANLPKAVHLLSNLGEVKRISSVWESEAVGADGPNYLNICVLLESKFALPELKRDVIDQIELSLGRVRGADKFAPRTIDIDIVLFDDQSLNNEYWKLAFIVIPLAEVHPEFEIPTSEETLAEAATRLRNEVWMEARRGVLG